MKTLILIIVAALFGGSFAQMHLPPYPKTPVMFGGLAARPAAQETTLPPDQWCQRENSANPKAHVCTCKKHECTKPGEPSSASEDKACTAYCKPAQCLCVKTDCG